jgi:ribulose 1,5-bisphosphate carboxylase large subunit-like protein
MIKKKEKKVIEFTMKKIKKSITHINANTGNKPVYVLNVTVVKFANIEHEEIDVKYVIYFYI